MSKSRTLVAFLIAPLATPIVLVVGMALMHEISWADKGTWGYLLVFAVLTYPSVLLLGVPSFYVYRRRGLTSVTAYGLGGAAIGLATALAWGLAFSSNKLVALSSLFIAAGIVSALSFRSIAHVGT